jgi:hypothetical protein
MGETLPRIKAVMAKPPAKLLVTFKSGDSREVDLTGFLARYVAWAPLKQQEIFAAAEVIDWGAAIGWPGEIDISAALLQRVAEEQQPFTGRDFNAWMTELKLSNQEAADVLGVSLSTLKNMKNSQGDLGSAFAITCRAMRREPTLFAAHFRPRVPGRPSRRLPTGEFDVVPERPSGKVEHEMREEGAYKNEARTLKGKSPLRIKRKLPIPGERKPLMALPPRRRIKPQ